MPPEIRPTKPAVESPMFPHDPKLTPSQIPTLPPKQNHLKLILTILALVIVLIIGGLYLLGKNVADQNLDDNQQATTTTSQETSIATSSEQTVSQNDDVNTLDAELKATTIDDSDTKDLDQVF